MRLPEGLQVVHFSEQYLPETLIFSDKEMGPGFYTKNSLIQSLEYSMFKDKLGVETSCSYLILGASLQVLGLRITYAPGTWLNAYKHKVNHMDWPSPLKENPDRVGYFKTAFLDNSLRGMGLGPYLAHKSISDLRKTKCLGFVTHSWRDSPNNSSQKYLEKLGFRVLSTKDNFWSDVDCDCTACHEKPCSCTAIEMIYEYC